MRVAGDFLVTSIAGSCLRAFEHRALALIKCKECGSQVSRDAKCCPHCGSSRFDTPPAAKEAVTEVVAFGCMGIFAFFLLLVLIAALSGKH
jgi:hypothetical protein